MARIPRLLPLIAVAIGGVVAVRAIGVAPGLHGLFQCALEHGTARPLGTVGDGGVGIAGQAVFVAQRQAQAVRVLVRGK